MADATVRVALVGTSGYTGAEALRQRHVHQELAAVLEQEGHRLDPRRLPLLVAGLGEGVGGEELELLQQRVPQRLAVRSQRAGACEPLAREPCLAQEAQGLGLGAQDRVQPSRHGRRRLDRILAAEGLDHAACLLEMAAGRAPVA